MKNAKKKYLIVLGSFLVVLFATLIGLFVYEYVRIKPNDVRFTNVTSSSVTVSWNTDKAVAGTVKVFEGESKMPISFFGGERFFDTRDVKKAELLAVQNTADNIAQEDSLTLSAEDFDTEIEVTDVGEYYTHHVTITGLDQNSRYTVMIGEEYLFRKVNDDYGREMIMTRSVLDNLPSPYPVYGSIKDADLKNDTPIDELEAVNDAVVYFNYWDKVTDQRSDTFSSSVNDGGNWYTDVSQAIDLEMEYFLEKYDTVEENVFSEIVVDAGPLGMWMMREYSSSTAPVSTIVLNMVDAVEDLDIPGSVIKLEENSDENAEKASEFEVLGKKLGLIKGVYADPGSCYSSGGSWSGYSCTCPSTHELIGDSCQLKSTCTRAPGYCDCVCTPESSDYFTTVNCRQTDNCGKSCGNPTTKSCRKPTPPCDSDKCYACTPRVCSGTYPLTYCPDNKECDKTTHVCNYMSECNTSCPQIATRTCYKVKATTPDPDPDPDPETNCESPAFSEYCGPCVGTLPNGSYGDECTCPKSTLTARACVGGDKIKISERLKCAGGSDIDDTVYYQNACRLCSLVPKGAGEYTYYQALWRDVSSTYEKNSEGKCVKIGSEVEHECPYVGASEGSAGNTNCRVCLLVNGVRLWQETACDEEIDDPDPTITCGSNNVGESCGQGKICGEENRCITPYVTRCYSSTASRMNALKALYNSKGFCYVTTCYEGYKKNLNDRREGGGYASCSKEGVIVDPDPVLFCGPSNVGVPCQRYFENGVCSTNDNCVIPGSECNNGYLGKWNELGKCEQYTLDELCWTKRSRHTLYKGSGSDRMRCSDGLWVEDPENSGSENWCKLGQSCEKIYDICFASAEKSYICNWTDTNNSLSSIWKEYKVDEDIVADVVDQIKGGEQCKESKCRCATGVDNNKFINRDEWCRESSLEAAGALNSRFRICRNEVEGAVCSKDGITCTYWTNPPSGHGDDYYCNGKKKESVSSNNNNGELISFKNLIPKILGQESNKNFLIDQSTGMFAQIEEGSYAFEYQGEYYSFDVGASNPDGNLIYIDKNSNNEFDKEVDINVTEIASTVNIVPIEKSYYYNIEEGLNFVSFPFLISYEDYRTAAGLLTKLNEVYDNSFYSISKFDGRWKIVGQNVEVYDSNDFQLIPGEGYMIKSKRDIDISILGQPVQFESESDKAPIHMSQGWNLIGLYGTGTKTYTAKSLIQDINSKDLLEADNVTQWAKDKQMYEGLQMSEGQEYGFDYPINQLESYFVRIIKGKGNWQPELSGNN